MQLKAKLGAMVEKIPASWKTELVSALHTFVAAFLIEVGMHMNEFSVSSVSSDILKGVVFAAVRSGVKAILLWSASKLKK